jgi:hypothetical protein
MANHHPRHVSVVDYVHADGTPYDPRPLQRDRVSRVLDDSLAKPVIDRLFEVYHPPDELFVRLTVGFIVGRPNPRPSKEFKVVLPVQYAEFDEVGDTQWWDREIWYEELDVDNGRFWSVFSKVYPRSAKKFCKLMNVEDGDVEIYDVEFVDRDGQLVDISTIDFQKKRVAATLGEGHLSHPDLHVRFSVTVGNDQYNGHLIKLIAKVPERVAFEDVHDWIFVWPSDRGTSANKMWELTQAQHPEVWKAVKSKLHYFTLPLFQFEDENLEYVHADGTPYDTTPLQKDRVSRLLDEPEL